MGGRYKNRSNQLFFLTGIHTHLGAIVGGVAIAVGVLFDLCAAGDVVIGCREPFREGAFPDVLDSLGDLADGLKHDVSRRRDHEF